jgi:hypothetical protein
MNLIKLYIPLFTLFFFTACGQSNSSKSSSNKMITRNLQQDISTILPEGEHIVDVMDEVTMSPRRQELQAKFIKSMQENSAWWLKQRQLIEETGKEMSYDTRIGMTELEWEEYKQLSTNTKDIQAISSGKEKVTIIKNNNIISFKSEGKLTCLNSMTIDFKNNTVKILNYELTPIDTVNVPSAENTFKSAWRGYRWQFSEKSSDKMPTNQQELMNFSMKLYGLTLGIFENNKKSYLEISGAETSGGKQSVKYKIPIVF